MRPSAPAARPGANGRRSQLRGEHGCCVQCDPEADRHFVWDYEASACGLLVPVDLVDALPVLPAPRAKDADEPSPVLLRLDDVRPAPVRWLWPGRIPLGKLTVLDGDPGLGKSLLTLDLAARVSTGRATPDGTPGPGAPGGVVLLSAEDDLTDTIRPRLDAAGADVSRVVALAGVRAPFGDEVRERLPTLGDVAAMREAIERVGVRLVVIDPLMAYIAADAHVDADVRQRLAPLAKLAAETGVAVVVIRHLNKSGGGNPLYRGGGSIGIIAAARSGLLDARDPDDAPGERRILACTKSNLAKMPPALAYRIEADAAGAVRVAWLGETAHTVSQLLAVPVGDDERDAVAEACAFIGELLGDGPVAAKDAQRAAREAGIADRTLDRAKARAGVRVRRDGFGAAGRWVWSLSERAEDHRAPTASIGRQPQEVAPYGDAGVLSSPARSLEFEEGEL